MELSFGEQIKILLNRKHMTIKDLADLYTQSTGQPMSRQNLTQRLKRDNFPEQDMYTIAGLLGYRVSIRLEPADRIVFIIPFSALWNRSETESSPQILSTAERNLWNTVSFLISSLAVNTAAKSLTVSLLCWRPIMLPKVC